MPLPTENTKWPPAPYDQLQKDVRKWNAWYMGDVDTLAGLYGRRDDRSTLARVGLIGVAKRMFHGSPATGEARKKLHLPIPADLARTSADLLFAEPPTFVVGDGTKQDKTTQDAISNIFGTPQTASELLEAGELQAALSGVYMRITWDAETSEWVSLDAQDADAAVPEWSRGRLDAVTFWQRLSGGGKGQVYRFLERHERGFIEYGLFMGDEDFLGVRIPLDAHPDTIWAASVVNADSLQETGATGLTAVYIPNIRPNRGYRNTPGLSLMGRSDFDQLESLFDAADETYSALMREISLGKARAVISSAAMQDNGPGNGSTFDTDREIYSPINGVPGSLQSGLPMEFIQPDIRSRQLIETTKDIMGQILRTAGYSGASFGGDDMVTNQTATEVNSRRELSNRTRNKKIQYWKAALTELGASALEVQSFVHGTSVHMDTVNVRFPKQTDVAPQVMAATLSQLNAAEAISIEQKVRMLHPNWSSEEINDEVDAIRKERGTTVTDPTQIKY
ncbi:MULTISPECIES: phage portal protein [unclassified Arthrobacter]|uniref:phage portal protein n=1 Tax=unclassified Arthrobacter TaxID=235627 RepID=UPI0015E479A5|nr:MULTISPECIES: phage portal protein [unclassified Arthrobacter]